MSVPIGVYDGYGDFMFVGVSVGEFIDAFSSAGDDFGYFIVGFSDGFFEE